MLYAAMRDGCWVHSVAHSLLFGASELYRTEVFNENLRNEITRESTTDKFFCGTNLFDRFIHRD